MQEAGMAYMAELSTDGGKLMLGIRQAADDDMYALQSFDEWARAEARQSAADCAGESIDTRGGSVGGHAAFKKRAVN